MVIWMHIICMLSGWCHFHPIVSCVIKIHLGLTFLVPAYPGCPRKGPLNGCVCVCVCLSFVELEMSWVAHLWMLPWQQCSGLFIDDDTSLPWSLVYLQINLCCLSHCWC